MSVEMIVRNCAPTLAGIKTGSIFSCGYSCREELLNDIRKLNRALVPKGLRVIPLRCKDNRALVYLFRPSELASDLSDEDAKSILCEAGYRCDKVEHCILDLIHRLNSSDAFPHEIGVFLSYPPGDVRGFIQNKAQNCKCVGCWKVYGDEAAAKMQFERYRKCTEAYCRQCAMGIPVEQLTVAS